MRLYAAISHHGYGHLAQTAPVLNAVAARLPDLELIVRCALPAAVIAQRVALPFRHLDMPSDCNFVMRDSLRVDLPASLAAYRAFHADWPGRVEREAEALARLGVDRVFSNVGYLPLAAARRAGIASVALCSLNWADIFAHYLGAEPGSGPILDAMRTAYAGARAFLRPAPSMPMGDLGNAVAIPPIAQAGRARRAELRARLGVSPDARVAILGLGGIPHRLPVEDWSDLSDVTFLLPDAWQVDRTGLRPFAACAMDFGDMLASVDALVTKPGYGSFVEAARAGVPVLYLPRPDWPESVYLVDWLRRHARAGEMSEAALHAGDLGPLLRALWDAPAPVAPVCDGAEAAAGYLLALR